MELLGVVDVVVPEDHVGAARVHEYLLHDLAPDVGPPVVALVVRLRPEEEHHIGGSPVLLLVGLEVFLQEAHVDAVLLVGGQSLRHLLRKHSVHELGNVCGLLVFVGLLF